MPGVSISGVGILFDALGASDDLGAELPETAEAGASLNIDNRPNVLPDVISSVFQYAGIFYTRSLEVQPLETLACTVIYTGAVSLLVIIVKHNCWSDNVVLNL